MKNVDTSWKKSISRRLLISFICILLPIYVLSIIIYNWGIKTVREEISSSMILQVFFYLDGLEKEFQRIQTLQYDCLSDDNLNKLVAIPEAVDDIEKMQSILRLQQRLSAIKNSSAYIEDVFALIPAIDRKISALTVSEFKRIEYDKLKYIPLSSDAQMIDIDGRLFLNTVYPFTSDNSKKEPLFIIVVEISKDKVWEALHSMTNSAEENIIFINPISQSVITTKNDSDFFGSILCKYAPEDTVFQSLRKYRGWFVLLLYQPLEFN